MAQSVEQPALDISSGRDLGVPGSSPVAGSLLSGESVFPSHSALSLLLAPQINFKNLKNKNKNG